MIEDPVEDLYQDVQASLIAPDRVTMMMVTIEDGKTKANQWSLGIALQKLSVGASDQIVNRFGEEQRAHVPEILARINFTVFAKGRRGQQCFRLFSPGRSAVGAENMYGFRAQFKQESGQAQRHIRIAKQGKLLAMNVRIRIGDSIDEPATFFPERIRNRLAAETRYLHQKAIRALDADRMIEGNHLLTRGRDRI